jgi:hypothetical protein
MKIHAIQTGHVRIKTAQVEGRGYGFRRRLAIFTDTDWTGWLPTSAWAVLMHADNGGVNHLHGSVMGGRQCVHGLGPHSGSSPTDEAIVAGSIRAEVARQVAPWRSRSQDPEDSVENSSVIHPWHAARLVGQRRLDSGPLIVAEFVAHDSLSRSGA